VKFRGGGDKHGAAKVSDGEEGVDQVRDREDHGKSKQSSNSERGEEGNQDKKRIIASKYRGG